MPRKAWNARRCQEGNDVSRSEERSGRRFPSGKGSVTRGQATYTRTTRTPPVKAPVGQIARRRHGMPGGERQRLWFRRTVGLSVRPWHWQYLRLAGKVCALGPGSDRQREERVVER